METIMNITEELKQEANRFAYFRTQVKEYLKRHGRSYDKFTTTPRDSQLGYLTEAAVRNYLVQRCANRYIVEGWDVAFDMNRIYKAVATDDEREIDYVSSYFYDSYDLMIQERSTGRKICVDVKTAETWKPISLNWNYLYPVIQNQKAGKDCVILCYYHKSEKMDQIVLIGYMTEAEIATCQILKADTKTVFGTRNQIDNYETKVRNYKSLSHMLENYFG